MRSKTICLTLLLMLTAISAFSPRLLAASNEGDWTPTYKAQWWWKYVRPAGAVIQVTAVDVAAVRSDRAGYLANRVTVTLTNRGSLDYKGGATFMMEHGFCDPDPQPWIGPSSWRPVVLVKGLLPAVQSGRSIQVSAIAYTPETGKYENYNQFSIGQ